MSAHANQRRSLVCSMAAMAAVGPAFAAPAAATNIVVGQSIALTGPLAVYGQAKRDGSRLYFDLVNRRGGVHGRSIELISRDDAYDPLRTVANTRSLVAADKAIALLGYFGVQTIDAVMPVIEQLRVPAVGLTSGSKTLRNPPKAYVFPVRASFFDEARQLISHAKLLRLNRLAVVFQENGYGRLMGDEFAAAARAQEVSDLQIVAIANDGSNAAEVVRALRPDRQAVMLAAASGPAIPFIAAMAQAKFGIPVYGNAGVDASQVTAKLGALAKGLGQSQVVPRPSSRTRRIVAEYLDAIQSSKSGAAASYFGLEGFIEAKVLVEGLKRIDGVPTSQALMRALESFGRWDLGDYSVTYGPSNRQGSNYIEMTVVNSLGKVIE